MEVLITGSASGIGNATVNYFLSKNVKVYGIDVLDLEPQNNLINFKADITNEKCLTEIKDYFINNNIKLDLIINIAGIHRMASLVETDYSVLKKVIDINLCGTMLVNKTFHECLKNNGKVIIVTSEVATFDPMPFNGLYNVSKTALDCYSQALRQELNLIGQTVITIRPGAIKTPLSDNSLVDTQNLADTTKLYKKQATKFVRITKKFMGTPLDANKLAKKIYKVSIKKHPKLVYKTHRNPGLVLLNILPKKWQCKIIKFILK